MRRTIDPADRRSLFALAGLLALCLAVGALAGAVTRPRIGTWYAGLQKPFFTPPDWVFAPVWTLLYIMMAFAAWRVWRTEGAAAERRLALRLFAAQLALNLAWSLPSSPARAPLSACSSSLRLRRRSYAPSCFSRGATAGRRS